MAGGLFLFCFFSSHKELTWVLYGVNVKGLGETLAVFYPNKFIPPSPSSLWPLRRMREERVFYDCASFYYQQEGSFCNLCMKFMSFPGERRGLTGEGGGCIGGAGRGFLPSWGGERCGKGALPSSPDQGSQTSRFGLC